MSTKQGQPIEYIKLKGEINKMIVVGIDMFLVVGER